MKARLAPHFERISTDLYAHLRGADRERFVQWLAKRWGGIDRVPADDMRTYASEVDRIRALPYATHTLGGRSYKALTLEPQGYHGELLTYPWMLGVHDFLFDQYQHDGFRIRKGETIIDAGAFVGDTALLFHQLAEGDCHIHAFEVLEENLMLLDHNLAANGFADSVTVNALALSEGSGRQVTIRAPAVQGATSIFGEGDGLSVETITIDDYVVRNRIEQIDLIKMDIEGAERLALAGATMTIRRDRPRLAICLYHRWDDMIEVPKLIHATGVPYRFGFKWVELRHGWEAVLFAMPKQERDA
ncbi:MAG TPA: FkbM family methyltransferase [Rhodocyclaceae bacterium]|nr:FkbM family methyltransferase [Rhodocyclaceae bacterium]HRQ45341.1 FkbM family methyltransferase [Rhodocyclaceae bacterium]